LAGEAGVQLHVRTPPRGEILRYQHHGPNDLRPGVAPDQHATRPDFQEHATAREFPRTGDGLKQRRIHRLDQRQHSHHARIPARHDRQVEARARRIERQRAAVYEVEIQKKLAIAAACVIFALLGVPVAIRFPRGGIGLVIGTSLAVFSVYYVGLIGGEELGDRLIVSPFLAMWTPNLLFAAVGLALLWVVRREASTAHGGDWDDLKHALLGWIPRLRFPG